MKYTRIARRLQAGTALSAVALAGIGTALIASPAAAQDAPAPAQETPAPDTANAQAEAGQQVAGDEIVVTGSILTRTDAATPSPITTVTTEDLDRRGITTVQGAIQQLSTSNGPSLTNSFSANGAFAGGASGASLRGLSTNSTLVLFDGMRASYYPLADDGSRNFVDLNTIPDDIVDHVEVLRDGASSSYGADAIAGVVNIITKKEVKGVTGRAEAGIAEGGYNASQRVSLTAGHGDLDDQGFNVYLSGFYYRSEAVYNRDLPAPFNSDDQRSICFDGTCGPNNVINGLDENGQFPNLGFGVGAATFFVRPYDGTNTTPQGRYQMLNPVAGCRMGTPYSPTPAELAGSNNTSVPTTLCQQDFTHDYGVVTPNIERFGASAHGTVRLGDTTEASLELNFQQSTVNFTGNPAVIRANANTGIDFPRFSTSAGPSAALAPGSFALTLPVYVCPTGVGSANGLNTGCDATNGTLNPNNPFAAAGQVARIVGSLADTPTFNETRSRVYRAALNVNGELAGGWRWNVNATAMHTDLRRRTEGYVYIQHLLDAVAQGTYNFVNPEQNSAAIRDYLSPTNIADASSDLDQLQVTVSKDLFELPGGKARLGVGGEIRYEAVDAPSANDDFNGPTERYFTLNAFGTKGHRTVASAFGEIDLPVFEAFDVNASGRYDHYSSGQNAFSPKVGVTFKPVRSLALRGTWSRGFRIPSFGEANALPTTGFVTQSPANIPAAFRAQYGAACATDPTACPTYLTAYSIGETSLATPDLEPEKSRSFTAGILFEPIRNVSFTVDFFDIKKTNVITSPSFADAIDAYYAGAPIPAGFTVTPDTPAVGFESATPRIAFVAAQLVNANEQHAQGIDFGVDASFKLADWLTWTSSGEASVMLDLSTTFPDGRKEKYDGTLGNFNLTAGSGTPAWHGHWTNSFDFGDFAVAGTLNYWSGYNLSAMDQGNEYKDCGLSPGYVPCDVSDYLTFDLNLQAKVADKFTFYVNALNLFDRRPPIDPVTYGAFLYNPVQGGDGIFGRQFLAGVKFGF